MTKHKIMVKGENHERKKEQKRTIIKFCVFYIKIRELKNTFKSSFFLLFDPS